MSYAIEFIVLIYYYFFFLFCFYYLIQSILDCELLNFFISNLFLAVNYLISL